jgi:hypothetical protein
VTLGQARAIREMNDAPSARPHPLDHAAEWDSLLAAADALITFMATKKAKAADESDALSGVIVEDEDDGEWVLARSALREGAQP